MRITTLICLLLPSLLSASAYAGEVIRVYTGGPVAAKTLNARQAEIEKATGEKVEAKASDALESVAFMVDGRIEGLVSALDVAETMSGKDSADKYQSFEIQSIPATIGLHPENPSTSLSKEQIAAILTGKVKSWDTINGRKDPISVYGLKSSIGMWRELKKNYTGGEEIRDVNYLTDPDGLLRRLKLDKGGIVFMPGKSSLPDFTPKIIETEVRYPLFFITKKDAKPSVQKVFEYLKKTANKKK